jgi:hypothetical protein
MIVLLAMTGFARAQAVWVDYSWAVEPAKENRFFAAVDKFTASETFKSFEGRMLVNAHAANGPAPHNFSFAVVYKDLATWEATQANLNGAADWDRFRKALAANGTLTGETVYTHVAGWGEINNERGGSWEGMAARVSDPQNYIARMSRLMDSSVMKDMPGSLDVWRVTAGGTPGVSHIVVFGDDSWSSLETYRTEAAKNPDFRAAIAGMAKVRTLLGAIWTTTVGSYGPLDLNSVR